MLNAVFTFSFFLTGLTIFIAAWYLGAIMKPIPTSSTHLATPCFKRSRNALLAWILIISSQNMRILTLQSTQVYGNSCILLFIAVYALWYTLLLIKSYVAINKNNGINMTARANRFMINNIFIDSNFHFTCDSKPISVKYSPVSLLTSL